MKGLVVGLDIDGVIVDLGTAMLPLLSEVCARPVAYQDLCAWDLGEALSISQETMTRTWEQLFESDALRYAPPIDGAINGLSTLSKHEIWLVTSRPIITQDLTLSWLYDNGMHYDQILFNRRGDKLAAGPNLMSLLRISLTKLKPMLKQEYSRFYLTNLRIKHPICRLTVNEPTIGMMS